MHWMQKMKAGFPANSIQNKNRLKENFFFPVTLLINTVSGLFAA